jgi:hypothetical protein
MEKNMQKNRIAWMLGCGVAGFGVLLLSMLLNPLNHYVSSLLLLAAAVVLYFLIVLRPARKNWMDIRAVFTGIWLGTIGLATLRLTEYQEPWQAKTWWALALAYLTFQLGATLGVTLGQKYYPKAAQTLKTAKLGRLRLQFRENRLFAICVITTLIGVACFAISIAIKGFVPCFSDDVNASAWPVLPSALPSRVLFPVFLMMSMPIGISTPSSMYSPWQPPAPPACATTVSRPRNCPSGRS